MRNEITPLINDDIDFCHKKALNKSLFFTYLFIIISLCKAPYNRLYSPALKNENRGEKTMFHKSRTIRYVENTLDELANQPDVQFVEQCQQANTIRSMLKSITAGLMQNEETPAHRHAITLCDRLQTLYRHEPNLKAELEPILTPEVALSSALRTRLVSEHVVIITDEEARSARPDDTDSVLE
jgi:hypothetical protein